MSSFLGDLHVTGGESCTYFGLVPIGNEGLFMLHARQPMGPSRHESQRHWMSPDPMNFPAVAEGFRLLAIAVMACLGFVHMCIGSVVLFCFFFICVTFVCFPLMIFEVNLSYDSNLF